MFGLRAATISSAAPMLLLVRGERSRPGDTALHRYDIPLETVMSSVTAGPEYADPRSADAYWAEQADHLAVALENGGWLEPREIPGLALTGGEVAYADLHLTGWRYLGYDEYEYERRALVLGGPFFAAVTASISLIGNCRRRREAAELAAPQWRPLGPLRVVVTSQRLLVWHSAAWWSVWYAGLALISLGSEVVAVDLSFVDDIPFRFAGSQAHVLAVMLEHLAGVAVSGEEREMVARR